MVGCPAEVGGCFYCYKNELSVLFGSPVVVDFSCNQNRLTTLEFCPVEIGLSFFKSDNKFVESELFLYGYDCKQVKNYYDNKNLNGKLLVGLSEEVAAGIKKKKL